MAYTKRGLRRLAIIEALKDMGAATVNQLAVKTERPVNDINYVLVNMERRKEVEIIANLARGKGNGCGRRAKVWRLVKAKSSGTSMTEKTND